VLCHRKMNDYNGARSKPFKKHLIIYALNLSLVRNATFNCAQVHQSIILQAC
jgi:hypothetical protein